MKTASFTPKSLDSQQSDFLEFDFLTVTHDIGFNLTKNFLVSIYILLVHVCIYGRGFVVIYMCIRVCPPLLNFID